MNKFHLVIDIVLYGEDIDDIFEQISEHYKDIMESKLEYNGTMSLEKVEDE